MTSKIIEVQEGEQVWGVQIVGVGDGQGRRYVCFLSRRPKGLVSVMGDTFSINMSIKNEQLYELAEALLGIRCFTSLDEAEPKSFPNHGVYRNVSVECGEERVYVQMTRNGYVTRGVLTFAVAKRLAMALLDADVQLRNGEPVEEGA